MWLTCITLNKSQIKMLREHHGSYGDFPVISKFGSLKKMECLRVI